MRCRFNVYKYLYVYGKGQLPLVFDKRKTENRSFVFLGR
jgi:hypothetical protein